MRKRDVTNYLLNISTTLRRIEMKIDVLLGATVKEKQMLEGLQNAVAAQSTVIDSVVELLNGLKAELDRLAQQTTIDPADIDALANAIADNTQRLAEAVAANTPAAQE
jgi:uncharacterized coiled-coil protein SlyX